MIKHLRYFLAAAETSSLTQASKQLNVSQPALTKSIKYLERKYQTELLIRSTSGVKLTEAGKRLYSNAQDVLVRYEQLDKKMTNKNDEKSETIKLGMIDNIGNLFISKCFSDYKNTGAKLRLNIEINTSTELIKLLENGRIDIAIITYKGEKLPMKLEETELFHERMYLVGDKSLIKDISETKDIESKPFITYNTGSTTKFLIDKYFEKRGVRLNEVMHSSSPELIGEFIRQKLGIGVMPETFLKLTKYKKLNRFDPVVVSRQISVVKRKDVYLSKAVKRFLELISITYLKESS